MGSVSVKSLSKEEREGLKQKMLSILIADEEIRKYDALVMDRAYRAFIARWSVGRTQARVCMGDPLSVINKTGLTSEDLLQFGRMCVLHQLRYYRVLGDRNKYGASVVTLIQQYLDQKFTTLANRYAAKKRGGKFKTDSSLNITDEDGGYIISGIDYDDPERVLLAKRELERQLEAMNGTE